MAARHRSAWTERQAKLPNQPVADQAKIGRDWDEAELDAIVTDYFAMLSMEQRGQAYVKAHRAAALMEQIGRTHRSVEFKHMNISAVLSMLGLSTSHS